MTIYSEMQEQYSTWEDIMGLYWSVKNYHDISMPRVKNNKYPSCHCASFITNQLTIWQPKQIVGESNTKVII